jgi:hypothetical protein
MGGAGGGEAREREHEEEPHLQLWQACDSCILFLSVQLMPLGSPQQDLYRLFV